MKSDKLLRRYTDVTSLLHILIRKEITLLDPNTWEDKNDSKFMSIYKNKKNLKSLLALCFTDAPETNHHWKVFAPGNSGVCIRFKKSELLDSIDAIKNIKHDKVIYKPIDELEHKAPEKNDLPFLKRYPFHDEKEYRIIYTDKSKTLKFKHIKIDLNSISRVVLSPLLHKNLAATLRKNIKSIEGCEHIRIYRTTLNESERWIACGENSV